MACVQGSLWSDRTSKRMRPSALVCVLVAASACSGTTATTSESSALPTQTSSSTSTPSTSTSVLPTSWSIAISASVSSPNSEVPFHLEVNSPITVTNLATPTTVSMRATANSPGLVIVRAEVFTARLRGSGTLDVVGPGCPADHTNVESPLCSADPVIIPIGVNYGDPGATGPTGSVIPSASIRLVLITTDVRPGTYHLVDSAVWQPVNREPTSDLEQVDLTIDITVTAS